MNELKNIVKELKKQYPKLRFDTIYDPYNIKNFGYSIAICYEVNDIIEIASFIYIDSDGPVIEVNKPMVTYIYGETDKITNKYFESIGTKGVEGLALIKDCLKTFNSKYKKQVLKMFKEE